MTFLWNFLSPFFDTKWHLEDNWWSWETAVTFVFFFVNNPFCGIVKCKNPVYEKNRKKYDIYTKYQFLSSNWITRENYYCQTTYLISITKRSARFVSSFFYYKKNRWFSRTDIFRQSVAFKSRYVFHRTLKMTKNCMITKTYVYVNGTNIYVNKFLLSFKKHWIKP